MVCEGVGKAIDMVGMVTPSDTFNVMIKLMELIVMVIEDQVLRGRVGVVVSIF